MWFSKWIDWIILEFGRFFFKVFFCYRTCSPGKWIHDWLLFHHSFLFILGQCVRWQWLICRSPNLPKCSHLPRAFWNICEIIMCGLFWAVQDLLVGQVNKETGTIPWTNLKFFMLTTEMCNADPYTHWSCFWEYRLHALSSQRVNSVI